MSLNRLFVDDLKINAFDKALMRERTQHSRVKASCQELADAPLNDFSEIVKRLGGKNGELSNAIEESIKMWLDKPHAAKA
jgi:hypothetical protein